MSYIHRLLFWVVGMPGMICLTHLQPKIKVSLSRRHLRMFGDREVEVEAIGLAGTESLSRSDGDVKDASMVA